MKEPAKILKEGRARKLNSSEGFCPAAFAWTRTNFCRAPSNCTQRVEFHYPTWINPDCDLAQTVAFSPLGFFS
jgi:hypothetical protein